MRHVVGLSPGDCEARHLLGALGRLTALLLLALVLAPAISVFVDGRASAQVKRTGLTETEKTAQLLDDPTACWIHESVPWDSSHRIEDFRPTSGRIVPPRSGEIYYFTGGRTVQNRTGTYVYPPGQGGLGIYGSRLRRVKPCPMGVAAASPFDWTAGLHIGGSLGSLSGTDGVTNLRQFTLCPAPPIPCTPDVTPSPSASLSSSGFAGEAYVEYDVQLGRFVVTQTPLIGGVEGFYDFANSNSTIPGIPGITGIAPWSIAANDRTTVKFGDGSGIIGKIGTIIYLGQTPFFVAFDGGIGWQQISLTFNCTMPGACGFNGISPELLSTSTTKAGTLLGFEINTPTTNLPVLSQIPEIFPFLAQPNARFEYRHGSYGSFTIPLGSPQQLQITANQHLTTDYWAMGINFGLQIRY